MHLETHCMSWQLLAWTHSLAESDPVVRPPVTGSELHHWKSTGEDNQPSPPLRVDWALQEDTDALNPLPMTVACHPTDNAKICRTQSKVFSVTRKNEQNIRTLQLPLIALDCQISPKVHHVSLFSLSGQFSSFTCEDSKGNELSVMFISNRERLLFNQISFYQGHFPRQVVKSSEYIT